MAGWYRRPYGDGVIIEVRTFRPRAGVEEAELRAVEADVHAAAMHCDGMVRRTTAIGEDGEWLVLQLWSNAAAAAAGGAVGSALEALAEPGSVAVRRYEDLGG
jgi:hypothetical protein